MYTETQPKTQGGARANCGRKPIADKKVQLYVFVRQSRLEKLGGKDEAKRLMNRALGIKD